LFVGFFPCSVGRLTTAVLSLLDFLPFSEVAFAMLKEIKCKQGDDKGKEGRMSSGGGDSNLQRCVYRARLSLQPQNVGRKQTA